MHEVASGNNPTLFDHSLDNVPPELTPAEAARNLVALQPFAIGGLITFEKGQDRGVYGSANNAPLTKGAVALVKGETLFQTLLLNLHQYNIRDGVPFDMESGDCPAWERTDQIQPEDAMPRGYLDLLTWQSRRVRLHPVEAPDGSVVVRHVVIMKGRQFPAAWNSSVHEKELFISYRKNAKPAKGQPPARPLSFREDRALWRDSLAIIQQTNETEVRPRIIDWLYDLLVERYLSNDMLLPVNFYGLASDRAKVALWRHERLPLPLVYLEDNVLLSRLRGGLDIAEKAGGILVSALVLAACKLLFPEKPESKLSRENWNQARETVNKSINPEGAYWPALESPFKRFMVDLAQEWQAQTQADDPAGLPAEQTWADHVRRAAVDAFRVATSGLDSSARALKALAQAEGQFYGRLNRILNDYTGTDEGGDHGPTKG